MNLIRIEDKSGKDDFMKVRTAVLSCLIGAVILSIGYDYSQADEKTEKPFLKVGVVSVRKIFGDCKRSERHGGELKLEENRVNAELKKLEKEIEAAEAGLETLKRESSDYLELERDVAQKRAGYKWQKAFYEDLLELKDRQWLKGFYKDILRITGEVAAEKGFDLVFERSEPDLSMVSTAGLLVTLQTHKLLYSAGCIDITDEVMTRLDEEGSKVKNQKQE